MAIRAPREYMALRSPRRAASGWPKSRRQKPGVNHDFPAEIRGKCRGRRISGCRKGRQTLNPCLDGLKTVHHGRVESRSPLDAERRRDQDEVQKPQVSFLDPAHIVGFGNLDQARLALPIVGRNRPHLHLVIQTRKVGVSREDE